MKKVSALVLLLAVGIWPYQEAGAQSVFLPSPDSPAQSAPPPSPPPPPPADSVFVPPQPTQQRRPPVAAVQSQRPNVPPPSGSTMGSVPPVQGLSPDQVAQARKAFEAMAAVNPHAAALNPFARFDAMQAGQEMQKSLERQVREACDLDFFNINLPTDFVQNAPVWANFRAYGGASLVSALRSACGDSKTQETLKNSVGMFGVKHRAGQVEPQIEGGAMQITFVYDFTMKDPPSAQLMSIGMKNALDKAGSATQALLRSYENVDQPEMERRMGQGSPIRP
jgi:hypothetical protein